MTTAGDWLPAFDPNGRIFRDPSWGPFWDACEHQRLEIQRCRACGRWRWPPRGVCPGCSSWNAQWQAVPGDGTVAAYVVVHRAFDPVFAEAVPYVIGLIAIAGTDSQVAMLSNVSRCAPPDVHVGAAVHVSFDQGTTGRRPPTFELVATSVAEVTELPTEG